MLPSHRNKSIDFHSKSIDWLLSEGNTKALSVLIKFYSPWRKNKQNIFLKVDKINIIADELFECVWPFYGVRT